MEAAPERGAIFPWRMTPTVDVQTTFRTTAGMIEHLEVHRAKGHDVPDWVFADIQADAAENDAAMAPALPREPQT